MGDSLNELSKRVDTKISEGLSSTLTQFETRLERALESSRRTVETSLREQDHN